MQITGQRMCEYLNFRHVAADTSSFCLSLCVCCTIGHSPWVDIHLIAILGLFCSQAL